MKILICDDRLSNRELFQEIIEGSGHEAVVTSTQSEAQQKLDADPGLVNGLLD